MSELTEIDVKLEFMRNTKETPFSLFKTFLIEKVPNEACFFLAKC